MTRFTLALVLETLLATAGLAVAIVTFGIIALMVQP